MTPSLYHRDERLSIIHGDCIEVMRDLPDDYADSIVTDPPYGLGFMGKEWDALPPGEEWARECLRVLKPGGHLLAFGGTRTWHRLAVAVEDAGFEIRDSIAWMYGSGFPKSMDLGKKIADWNGWGTALKPAFEPVVVARKPLSEKTVAANVLEHGTGAIHVDACRIPTDDKLGGGAETRGQQMKDGWHRPWMDDPEAVAANAARTRASVARSEELGRWPANVALDEFSAAILDEQAPSTGASGKASGQTLTGGSTSVARGKFNGVGDGHEPAFYGDKGGASRFFYVAKAKKSERPVVDGTAHPTVKPLELMRWLVKLVTPTGGIVLDPFLGSGTTAQAALEEGFRCIGIELTEDYLPLIAARLGLEERDEAA